jgi:hypothetical protein
MTDQALSGDGQHQHWAASGEQREASGGGGWQQGGSHGAAGWRHCLTWEVLFCWVVGVAAVDRWCMC